MRRAKWWVLGLLLLTAAYVGAQGEIRRVPNPNYFSGPVGIGTTVPASGLAVGGPIVGDAKIGATVTMSGNVVLTAASDEYLLYNPNGSDRTMKLWTPAAGRTPARVIKHDGVANNIAVLNPADATLVTLTTTDPVCTVVWNGSAWEVF